MNAQEVKVEFWKLVALAMSEWEERDGLNEIEPVLVDILFLAKKNPVHESELKSAFLELVHLKEMPVEILEFCMHDLRWPEIRQEVEKVIAASADPRERSALERVLSAYAEDWEDLDLYKYYREGLDKATPLL